MLFAVIGGIHGNLAALDSALGRIDELGIHSVLCAGNIAVGHADPNPVFDRLRDRRVVCVQGEFDRLVVRALRKADSLRKRLGDDRFDALERAHDSLTSSNLEFLRALPHRIVLSFEGKSVYLCHGTVTSQSTELRMEDSIGHFQRQREAANADIIVCGSDDDAFVRVVDRTLFVNPGGLDAPDCVASFYVVDTDADPLSAEMVCVR